jgi:hypothetical protein
MMRHLVVLAGLWTLLVACGTETGNPEMIPLTYNATTSAPARVAIGSSDSADVRVETVWLRLEDVTLTACDDSVSQTAPGLGLADHGGPDAALQTVELADTTWCGLSTALRGAPDAVDEPVGIAGSAVAISGTVDGRAFSILSTADVELDLALPDIPRPDDGSWLLGFDVAEWIDVDALRALPGEPIVVDADTEPAFLEAFEGRLAAGVHLWADRDGDGQVDDDDERLDR